MSIHGYLHTMSLPDLLQWASVNKKTGILELERHKISKRITFRDGRIAACSSNDPPSLMGQFLLSRGKITKEQLQAALAAQKLTDKNLGMILQEMGTITREELENQVAAKAEENVYSLFDWPDAVFRYSESVAHDPNIVEVDLSVDEVLMNGIKRLDELHRIRRIFLHSGIVLGRSQKPVPSTITNNVLARRVLESVTGDRTLAEILLHAHASDFLVLKFLFTLYRAGIVIVFEERPADPEANTILDTSPLRADLPEMGPTVAAEVSHDAVATGADQEIQNAMLSLSQGDYAGALQILNARYREQPGDNHLRQLVVQAEAGYLAAVRAGKLDSRKVPALVPGAGNPAESKLQPNDLFLVTLIDGKTDIQSLVWVAPLREVDVLMALERMLSEGLIELRDPEAGERTGEQPEALSVQWSPF